MAVLRSPLLLTGAFLGSIAVLGAAPGGCLGSAVMSGSEDLAISDTPRPDMAINLQAEFETKVQPILLGDCGSCHAQAGGSYPGFLSPLPVSVYNTFINFPGLVGYTPETSRILTKGPHANPQSYTAQGGYTPTPTLAAHAKVIADWITLFNANGGHDRNTDMGATQKRITPYLPQHNVAKSFDLGELDAQYTGMSVSFTPVFSPAPPAAPMFITLKDLKLTASATSGVHVKSPVFARYKASEPNVAVDIDYDYLGKDITASAGTSADFDPTLVIFAYGDGELLGLSFEAIDLRGGGSDMGGGSVGQCKNVSGFAAFKPQLTGSAGINCANCHNGGAGGFSTSGFNNAANDATSCAGTLPNVVVATPAQSPLYLAVTDGSAHTGGKLQAAAAMTFLNQLTTWLNGEK